MTCTVLTFDVLQGSQGFDDMQLLRPATPWCFMPGSLMPGSQGVTPHFAAGSVLIYRVVDQLGHGGRNTLQHGMLVCAAAQHTV